MKIAQQIPSRIFCTGTQCTAISDCGKIYLDPDEQITFMTPSGKEYDFAAKSWGYYATPSVNGRLVDQGFKTALVKNRIGKYYVLIVDIEHLSKFNDYLATEESDLVEWLDERGNENLPD